MSIVENAPGNTINITQVNAIDPECLTSEDGEEQTLDEIMDQTPPESGVTHLENDSPFEFPSLGLSDDELKRFSNGLSPAIERIYEGGSGEPKGEADAWRSDWMLTDVGESPDAWPVKERPKHAAS